MILIDVSQITIGTATTSRAPLDAKLIRHIVLNTIRSYRARFGPKYGDLVICADGMNSWRRSIFPQYKASRRKSRSESTVDWNQIFSITNMIRDEIAEFVPCTTIHIDNAEADDIIGTLCNAFGEYFETKENPILIISSDKDFGQLQKYDNVSQFNPLSSQFIHVNNPEQLLREHILYGDRGDGIPNFLSEDDCFVANRRQKPIPAAKVKEWSLCEPEAFSTLQRAGFERNRRLIDLSFTPPDIKQQILDTYSRLHSRPMNEERHEAFRQYLERNELNYLLNRIGDFT